MSDLQTYALLVLGGCVAVFSAVIGVQLRRGVAFRKLPTRR